MSLKSPSLKQLQENPRITIRRHGVPNPTGQCVVYWMQRAQRGYDNSALDTAIQAGNLLGKPVVVFLAIAPCNPEENLRHYHFLFQGFAELESSLLRRNVGFVLRFAPEHSVAAFSNEVKANLVIGDENPLRGPLRWREKVSKDLTVPFWTVDSDVIVPSRLLLKEHYAARIIRPRIHEMLTQFVESPRRMIAHTQWKPKISLPSWRPSETIPKGFEVGRRISTVGHLKGGPVAAQDILKRFVRRRLRGYAGRRNRPEEAGTSQLSPYLHFGHIGPQTIVQAIMNANVSDIDRDVFLEELIVRRELAVNYVHFNASYDRLVGFPQWALKTLNNHRADKRDSLYSEEQLEFADTHDPLWNASQKQMMMTGWMHGYMRMYWAKKILEWSQSPEAAMEQAIRLNDRYELDGSDPNGYAGIAWAVGGKHDRAWGPERPVFGKVRYMSFNSTKRKFDSASYIKQWSGEASRA